MNSVSKQLNLCLCGEKNFIYFVLYVFIIDRKQLSCLPKKKIFDNNIIVTHLHKEPLNSHKHLGLFIIQEPNHRLLNHLYSFISRSSLPHKTSSFKYTELPRTVGNDSSTLQYNLEIHIITSPTRQQLKIITHFDTFMMLQPKKMQINDFFECPDTDKHCCIPKVTLTATVKEKILSR